MSRRNKRGAKPEPAASPKRRTFLVLSKRRFALAAVAGLLTMLLMAILGGRVPPRITLINRTGEPLAALKIVYPGGTIEPGDLPDGEKASFALRPDPDAAANPAAKSILVTWMLGNKLPGRFFSSAHGLDYGAHDVITLVRQPDGSVAVIPNPSSGWGFNLKPVLRRIGIRL